MFISQINDKKHGTKIVRQIVEEVLYVICHYALCNVQSTKEGGEHEPFAVKMRLGWIVFGANGRKIQSREVVKMNFHKAKMINCSCEELHDKLRHYMTTDAFGVTPSIKPLQSVQVERALEIFE